MAVDARLGEGSRISSQCMHHKIAPCPLLHSARTGRPNDLAKNLRDGHSRLKEYTLCMERQCAAGAHSEFFSLNERHVLKLAQQLVVHLGRNQRQLGGYFQTVQDRLEPPEIDLSSIQASVL